MNDHERLREHLVLRLAGELDVEDARHLDEHVAVCPECREELASLLPLAPPRVVLEDTADVSGFDAWRERVLAGTTRARRSGAKVRQGLVAASLFVGGLALGLLGGRGVARVEAPPSSVARGSPDRTATEKAPSRPFALREAPVPAPPSGFLAAAASRRPR